MLLEEMKESKLQTTINTFCLVQNSLLIMVSKYF